MVYPPTKQLQRPTLHTSTTQPPETKAAERTARHLSMCQELAELGMDLARAAARLALQDWETPETPALPPTPQTPLPTPTQTIRRIADPGLLFARISRAVRQSIALEARIAADATTHRQTPRPTDDPRRAVLRRAFREATANHPDQTELRRDTEERVDHELAIDPGHQTSIPELIAAISEDLGIPIDYAHAPDHFLFHPKLFPPQQQAEPPAPPPWRPHFAAPGPEPPNPLLGR